MKTTPQEKKFNIGHFIYNYRYIILSLIYVFIPAIIFNVFYFGKVNFVGIHGIISDLGVCLTIIYLLYKKSITRNKSNVFFLLSFLSLFIADTLYVITLQMFSAYSTQHYLTYTREITYTLFVSFFFFYLTTYFKEYIVDKFFLAIMLLIFFIFYYLHVVLILLPSLRNTEIFIFFSVNNIIYELIKCLCFSIVFCLLPRINSWFLILFFHAFILFGLSDFALTYQTTIYNKSVISSFVFEQGWNIATACFFVLTLFGHQYFLKKENLDILSFKSIRTYMVLFISGGLLSFMSFQYFLNLYSAKDAFELTNLLLVGFGVWIVSNLVATFTSKRITKNWVAMQALSKDKKDEELLYCINKRTNLDEIDFIIKEYNSIVQNNNILVNRLIEQSSFATIASMANILAHDVKKPFAQVKAILDNIDMFYKKREELGEAIVHINKNIEQVEGMIADMFDYSKKIEVKLKPSSVTNAFYHALSVIISAYGNKDYDIKFHYSFKNKYRPLTDDSRLAGAYGNIIGNAIEAITLIAKRTGGNIYICTADMAINDCNYIQISIENDGPCFQEQDIPKLFKTFFTKGKSRGTGLGLASAYKIIKSHHGNISAQNSPDSSGVKFSIELLASTELENQEFSFKFRHLKNLNHSDLQTLTDDQNQDSYQQEILNSLSEFNERYKDKIKILLLEDDFLYRAAFKNIISKREELHSKIIIYDSATVDEAILIVKAERIDHAIVDIDLSDTKNGFDFLLHAKENFPDLKSLLNTDRFLSTDIDKIKSLGAKGISSKPIKENLLINFLLDKNLWKNIN
ncbi:MAG: GHKL domain-containing protein [Oligoflexia bacterium]|nr:GHKL domain-containing protein [Oligoflexia bacterium]